jgi:hypothetical protein
LISTNAAGVASERSRRRQAKKEDSGTAFSWQNRATGRPLASCRSMTDRHRTRAVSDCLLMPQSFAAPGTRGEMRFVQRTHYSWLRSPTR